MSESEFDFAHQSNQQLVETLVRSSEKAEQIVTQFSIESLADIGQRESKLTPGAYKRLRAGIELGRRIQEAKTCYEKIVRIKSSSDAVEFCRAHFSRLISDSLQEQFHVITLDTKNKLLDTHHVTTGTLDASLVHPREVFRPAIRDAASSILLAHNHPSGDPSPSHEDYSVTRRLTEVGKMIGIDVLDHIVMGKSGVVSIRETE
ncbi:MAG: DNA repair protein RadC [Planctomycetota bacterium]